MPNLLQYSNGWGHIIMSVSLLAVSVVMILQHDPTLEGVGIGLIGTVAGYWFVSSSANAQAKVPAPTPTPATPTTQGGNTNGTANP